MRTNPSLRALSLAGALALALTASSGMANAAGLIDTEALMNQVPLCKVVHGFIKAPCAGKLLGDKILPYFFPIEVTGLRASATIIDLDTGDWKSKAASWLNKGLDWLGVPDRYRIPKKIGYDFAISMSLSNVKLAIPKGKEYQPTFGATLRVSMEVLSSGLFKGKKFGVAGRVEGKMYLTVAPHGEACTKRTVDWTMGIVNLELTKLDVDKIPDFIDGSSMFKSILNWALSKKFDDYPEYNTRGIAFCMKGNCPLPKAPAKPASTGPAKEGVLKLGGLKAGNKYLSATRRPDGGFQIKITDAAFMCGIVNDVTRAGCTDNFVNTMASAVLPLSVPVPAHLAGPGLSVLAERFAVDLKNPAAPKLLAKASLRKTGEAQPFTLTLGTTVELKTQCTKDTFMAFVKPRIDSVSLSAVPRWLTNDVGRAAVNGHLKPMDFCFDTVKVPAVGKSINACKLTDALMKEQCTGPFINAVADGLFPLSVRPAEATALKNSPVLQNLLKGVSLTVQKATVNVPTDGRNIRVGVQVALKKDGERAALVANATAGFGVQMKCGKDKNVVRVTPAVEGLTVSAIPQWLLQSTVINLGNAAINKWQAICAYGPCSKQQKIDVSLPGLGLGGGGGAGGAAAPACSFDTFAGGK